MKTNKFFLTLATLMICVSSAFISCSSDDDNNGNGKGLGDNAVAALKAILLDDDNNIIFGEANEDGIYQIGLEDQNAARALVAKYVNNASLADDATLYTLPDGRGTVRVEKGVEEGVYYTVTFAVKEIPQMKLEVVDANYMDNENKISAKTSYKCNDCQATFKLFSMEAKKCTSCGSTNIVKN